MAIVVEDFIGGWTGDWWDTNAWATATSAMGTSTATFPYSKTSTTPYLLHETDNGADTNPTSITISATSASPSGGMLGGFWCNTVESTNSLYTSGWQSFILIANFGNYFGPCRVGWAGAPSQETLIVLAYATDYNDPNIIIPGIVHGDYNSGWYEFYIPSNSAEYYYFWYNGILMHKGTGKAVTAGNYNYTIRSSMFVEPGATPNNTMEITAAYLASGATPEDALIGQKKEWFGGGRVFSYFSGITTATPDYGDAFNSGTWDNILTTPTNTSTTASFTGGVSSGTVILDDSGGSESTGGLAVDSFAQTGEVVGAKVFAVAGVGGGGGTEQYLQVGKSATNMHVSANKAMVSGWNPYKEVISKSNSACPAVGDDLLIGVSKDGGGKDLNVALLNGSILFRPIKPAHIASINGISLSNFDYINGVHKYMIDHVQWINNTKDTNLYSSEEPYYSLKQTHLWPFWTFETEDTTGIPDSSAWKNFYLDQAVGTPSIVSDGVLGNCLSTGTGDYVSCSNCSTFRFTGTTDEFSLSIWFKPNTNNSDAKAIIGLTNSTSGGWLLFHQNSSWTFRILVSSTPYSVTISDDHTVGEWHHICCYYSNYTDEMGIKVNNGTWATSSTAGSITSVSYITYPLSIGGVQGTTYSKADGYTDLVGIWPSVFTDIQFGQLYYWGKGTYLYNTA